MGTEKWFYAIAKLLILIDPVSAAESRQGGYQEAARAALAEARVYRAEGRYSRAEEQCLLAKQIFERSAGTADAEVAESLIELGLAQKRQWKLREAERSLREALNILEKPPEPPQIRMALARANLASVVLETGRPGPAEHQLRRALMVLVHAYGPDHPEVGAVQYNLGMALQRQGRHQVAEDAYRESLRIFERAYGRQHPRVATSVNGLGTLAFQRGRLEEAQEWFSQALTATEAALGRLHPDLADTLRNLAAVHAAGGRHSDAEPLLARAVAILERSLGPDHPATAACLLRYAQALRKMEKTQLARSLEKRARAVTARWASENQLGYTVSVEQLRSGSSGLTTAHQPRGNPPPPQILDLALPRVAPGGPMLISH